VSNKSKTDKNTADKNNALLIDQDVVDNYVDNQVLYGELLRMLSAATNRPGMDPAVHQLVGTLHELMRRADATPLRLQTVKGLLSCLLREDRSPTPSEWKHLRNVVQYSQQELLDYMFPPESNQPRK